LQFSSAANIDKSIIHQQGMYNSHQEQQKRITLNEPINEKINIFFYY